MAHLFLLLLMLARARGTPLIGWYVLCILCAGYERKVQRKMLTLPSSPSITAFWMWNEMGTNYVLYDIQSSVDIELAYVGSGGRGGVDLSKCTNQLPYTIDFQRMEQIRHSYNTRRKVQRCPLPTGVSIQSLLCLTGSASLTGGGVAVPTHGMGVGFGGHAYHTGLGFGALTNPTPGVMSSTTPATSVPSGRVVKSGSAGLTRSGSRPGTNVLATLGVPLSSLTGNTAGLPLASTSIAASQPLHLPTSAAVSSSNSTPHVSTPSFPLSTPPTTSAPTSTSAVSSRPMAVAKTRRKKKSKTASNSSNPTSSVACGGSACSSSSVKSKRRGKKVRDVFDDETAKFARKKKKKPKAEEDGVSGRVVSYINLQSHVRAFLC